MVVLPTIKPTRQPAPAGAPRLQRVLRFEVAAPGSGEPVHRYRHKWQAITEARRLEEEHGLTVVVTPRLVTLQPVNPWGR